MVPPRRKKWTEAEERTLIEKYGEMVSSGTLAKMKTREKKFKPIALYVNSVHHVRDPVIYPWQWTWKDVSTKVQNMRHQYLLVKQKIKKHEFLGDGGGCTNGDEFDWVEGLAHWSNFLLYKEVFGDVAVACSGVGGNGGELMGFLNEDREDRDGSVGGGSGMEMMGFGHMGNDGGDFSGINGGEDGVLGGLGFDYEGEVAEENCNGADRVREDGDCCITFEEVEPSASSLRKKKRGLKGLEKRIFTFLSNQLGHLRAMEARFEQGEVEKERERQRRENNRMAREREWEQKLEERERTREQKEKAREKLREQRILEWEAMLKEIEERERIRAEELIQEREWQERISRSKTEWMKRIDGMLNQHRAEMSQVQTRILHEQQNLTSQLLGIFSHWTGHSTSLSDHTSASNHYISQMMQNLHHVNDMVHEDTRVDGDTQDDQFIVDG